MEELHPDKVANTQAGCDLISIAQVFEGHPFIVEAGVSIGGKDVKQGLNIFRFANRIPLLFEEGNDVVTRTAHDRIKWKNYKINQVQDKIGVFVSIVSTKIPFKGTGKEYIGDDITEIASAVKSAIQQCCVQLKSTIMKRMQAREQQQEREQIMSRNISSASGALYDALKYLTTLHPSKKSRFGADDLELLNKVADNLITKETLIEAFAKHCEQNATQSGVSEEPREEIYIQSLEAEHKNEDD